jgi:DNA-nicking Smr family endonuclease
MARKRKSPLPRERREGESPKPVFTPFKDLKKMLAERAAAQTVSPQPRKLSHNAPERNGIVQSAEAEPAQLDESALLAQAFAGVRPLEGSRASRIAVEPEIRRDIISEDAEVLAELSDLVSGQGPFELTETEEYVEGTRIGLDPRLVTRLRRGEFSIQAHLDLHGMTQADAKEALTAFILESVRKGRRAVLVVHGRGLRSPGGQAVLKHATAQWLSHGTVGAYVLAFATARPNDGGAGAVSVLLRRERRRAKFDVLQGTHRRD